MGAVEICECADYEHRGGRCKHIAVASIAQAKSKSGSCYEQRVLGRFLSEVTEDDALLSSFVADDLCADCIQAGFWT